MLADSEQRNLEYDSKIVTISVKISILHFTIWTGKLAFGLQHKEASVTDWAS
jgi:hypothetical protein